MQRSITFLLAALAATSAGAAGDHSAHRHGDAAPGVTATAAASELADGEVRKIDVEGRKLTIRHGPLRSLDMPAMTMVFGVQDAAWLDRLRVGQKIRFAPERIDGNLVVTRIEAVR